MKQKKMTDFELMHTPMTNFEELRRRKRTIHRCPFCNTDVSTPYKGIHKETELINGIPTQCRNNGKANIHIWQGYLQGHMPIPNTWWFVEHLQTRLWYNGFGGWTNDPNEAFKMEFEWTADRFARFEKLDKYIVTEHEFFDYQPKPVKK